MTISFPRSLAWEVSDCHIGIAVVFIPVPRPATILPMIICGKWYEAVWIVPPIMTRQQPRMIDRRRPSLSPKKIEEVAPRIHPMS